MAYRLLFRLVLTRLDAEAVHHVTVRLLGVISRVPPVLWLLGRLVGRTDPALAVSAFGVRFPTPLGMAAGFDKDAVAWRALATLGFGSVEVGTVTAEAQPGNPRPRMARLPADRAVVNRMGFNNGGALAARDRLLAHRPGCPVVGVNIGKTKVVAPEDAPADYARSARLLAPHADYLVVNVSSPNTPGLRDLQAVDVLRPVLAAVLEAAGAEGPRPPVLVKIAPDLGDGDVDAVADLAVELGLDGIIAANTTIGREGLASDEGAVAAAGAGGLSGPPLRDRALALLRRLHARVGDRLVLVSVGGVESADDVWERVLAGASLVQAYTGVVYGGPLFAWRLNRALSKVVARSGHRTLAEAIGTGDG